VREVHQDNRDLKVFEETKVTSVLLVPPEPADNKDHLDFKDHLALREILDSQAVMDQLAPLVHQDHLVLLAETYQPTKQTPRVLSSPHKMLMTRIE